MTIPPSVRLVFWTGQHNGDRVRHRSSGFHCRNFLFGALATVATRVKLRWPGAFRPSGPITWSLSHGNISYYSSRRRSLRPRRLRIRRSTTTELALRTSSRVRFPDQCLVRVLGQIDEAHCRATRVSGSGQSRTLADVRLSAAYAGRADIKNRTSPPKLTSTP